MVLDELVNKYYSRLNENDLYIWSYIVKNKKECMFLTIDQLASKCNVSRTTVLRFAQKISLKGYSELKVYLKWEKDAIVDTNLDYIDIISKDVQKFVEDFRKKDFTYVCSLIHTAKRIFIYGSGALQNIVASEMQRIFLLNDEMAINISGETEMKFVSNHITADDLVILISVSGESEGMRNIAQTLRVKNVPIVSITRMKNNDLAKICDESLYTNTSFMDINENVNYETVSLFFVLVEMLFLNYAAYKKKLVLENK